VVFKSSASARRDLASLRTEPQRSNERLWPDARAWPASTARLVFRRRAARRRKVARDISIDAATSASAPSRPQRKACAAPSCVSSTQHSTPPPGVLSRSVTRGRGVSSAAAHAAWSAASTALLVRSASKCSVRAAILRSVSSLGVGELTRAAMVASSGTLGRIRFI